MRILVEIYRALRKVDEVMERLARSAYPPTASTIVSHMTDSRDLPDQLGQPRSLQVRNIPSILRSQEEREKIEREWLRKYNPLEQMERTRTSRTQRERNLDA